MEGSHEPRISVIVNTYNEERNLPYALRSVRGWTDEIVVVDMHSEDRTVAVAREFGAQVYLHERVGFADPARAFAIAQTTGEWVLILDADELIPPALSEKIREIVRDDAADVVNFPREEYFFGAPLRETGWGPHQSLHTRFFKRGMLHANAAIHDFLKPMVGARVLDLPYTPGAAMIHFAYLDLTQYMDKLNRYTGIEVRQSAARGTAHETPAWVERDMRPYPPLLALFRGRTGPGWALLYSAFVALSRYVKNRGYRDGWRGAYVSLLTGAYFLVAYAKLTEREAVGTRADVEARYRDEAERILRPYGDAAQAVQAVTARAGEA